MALENTERFEILDELGRGGGGVVYEAYDRLRGMRVALKVLRRVSAEQIFRFKHEFRVLTNLSHPNIVTFYDLVHERDRWFLTMELVQGVDFLTYVRPPGASQTLDRETTDGAESDPVVDAGLTSTRIEIAQDLSVALEAEHHWPPAFQRSRVEELVDLGRLRSSLAQLAKALRILHAAGIIHRDVKPSNVRVSPEGRVVLMDFGIATEMTGERDLQRGTLMVGTPEFMAPEQVASEPTTDATDWFAFGVLLYLSLTGVLPHRGDRWEVIRAKRQYEPSPPSLRVEGVPRDLEQLAMHLLAREPWARPSGFTVMRMLGNDEVVPEARPPVSSTEDMELFVGREQEMGALAAAYQEVRNGGSGCVLVQGYSGIGKSSLLRYFLAGLELSTAPPLLLSGRSHERESLAYKAFDGIVDGLCYHLVNLEPDELDDVLPANAAWLARLFPVLQAIEACRARDGGSEWRDPDTIRKGAVTAFRDLLTALTQRQPIVLRTEDLQWADAGSFTLLQSLMDPPAIPGLLILATVRSEDLVGATTTLLTDAVERLEQHAQCRRVMVGPLSEAEQQRMALELIERRGGPLPGDARPWRTSAGHPMMLAELIRHMCDVRREDAGTEAVRLEDVIVARYARLSEHAQRLLEVIAVSGEPTGLVVLGEAAGLEHEQREQATVQLRHASLVRVSAREHTLLDSYHDRIRTAITEHLGSRVRDVHHALAKSQSEHEGTGPATIANHWLACGQNQDAAVHLVAAATIADDKLAFERSDKLRMQVLDILPDDGRSRAVAELRCEALIGLARRQRVKAQNEEALAYLERARASASPHDLVDRLATIESLRGGSLFSKGDVEACEAAHQQACLYAREAGSVEAEARALSGLGDAAYAGCRMASAYRHFSRCIELCREHGFGDVEIAALPMLSWMFFYNNEVPEAGRSGLATAARADELGHLRAAVVIRGVIGTILTELGELDRAQLELKLGLEQARALGTRHLEAHIISEMGKEMALRGDRGGALVLTEQALEMCRETGFGLLGPWVLAKLACVTEDPGRRRAALAEGEEALAGGAVSHNYLWFYREAMDVAYELGEPDRIDRYAGALEAYTAAEPLPFAEFFIERGRALAAYVRDPTALAGLREIHARSEALSLVRVARATRVLLP